MAFPTVSLEPCRLLNSTLSTSNREIYYLVTEINFHI